MSALPLMAATKLKRLFHKRDSIWFWIEARIAWGRVQYSADGETWHPSRSAAYDKAKAVGKLSLCKIQEPKR